MRCAPTDARRPPGRRDHRPRSSYAAGRTRASTAPADATSACRVRKKLASDAASVATTETAQTSTTTSMIRPGVVTGLGICELTVVSWAETQNSAPPTPWKPESRCACSNSYISSVASASSSSVDTPRTISRLRRSRCVWDAPRSTMRASERSCRSPGRGRSLAASKVISRNTSWRQQPRASSASGRLFELPPEEYRGKRRAKCRPEADDGAAPREHDGSHASPEHQRPPLRDHRLVLPRGRRDRRDRPAVGQDRRRLLPHDVGGIEVQACGVDIDLWTAIGLMVVAVLMIAWALLRPVLPEPRR